MRSFETRTVHLRRPGEQPSQGGHELLATGLSARAPEGPGSQRRLPGHAWQLGRAGRGPPAVLGEGERVPAVVGAEPDPHAGAGIGDCPGADLQLADGERALPADLAHGVRHLIGRAFGRPDRGCYPAGAAVPVGEHQLPQLILGKAGQARCPPGVRRSLGGGEEPDRVDERIFVVRRGVRAREHRLCPPGRVVYKEIQILQIRNGPWCLFPPPFPYIHAAPPAPWPRLTRARSSPSSSSVSAVSPPASTASVSPRLRASSSAIRSSTVPSAIRWCTFTVRCCPIRCARSVAWSSTAGFHGRSKWITWPALVRFSPVPAARTERMSATPSPDWNRSTISCRFTAGTPPCRNSAGMPRVHRCAWIRCPIDTYPVKISAASPAAATESISSSSAWSLPDLAAWAPASHPSADSRRKCAGELQICRSDWSRRSTWPRRAMPVLAPIRASVSAVAASYSAACSRVSST